MCGIAGWLGPTTPVDVTQRIGNALAHRGPDEIGWWVDKNTCVTLIHRRLSILDLSSAGRQPMLSASGRYVIVFNGEIYNHLSIRKELARCDNHLDFAVQTPVNVPDQHDLMTSRATGAAERMPWRGHSDTETLLAAIEMWGVEITLEKCIGMFAFALWDRKTSSLVLARDRVGEKPLYYGYCGNSLIFASELKAIKHHPDFACDIDKNSLALYLRHNYIPAPYTIYKNIQKLPAGTYLRIDYSTRLLRNRSTAELPSPIIYWSMRKVAEAGQINAYKGSKQDAINDLESILMNAVRDQMISDVPLGAFLSGGIDSSTIVALMQACTNQQVKTFTIGFDEKGYNEAKYAKCVADHIGCDHTELYVSPSDALDVIPKLPTIYDEPFSDSSQIPTYLVAALARENVTVALSGDGGDELFGGYNRYFHARRIWSILSRIPMPLRAMLSSIMTSVTPQAWNSVLDRLANFLPRNYRYENPGDKLHKLSNLLTVESQIDIYNHLVSHWSNPANLIPGSHEYLTALTNPDLCIKGFDFEHTMMYLDSISYLPDDILVKVDRAAMAVSLETRVPMLDKRVIEFAWRLPLDYKVANGHGKVLLREILYKYVPSRLIDRPKVGFGVPLDTWLRGPLRDWAENLLSMDKLTTDGIFSPTEIRRKWEEHLKCKRNWQYHLWDVLMFQAWYSEQNDCAP